MRTTEVTTFPYPVEFTLDEDGDIVGRCPSLKGCIAHGKDMDEAIRNMKSMLDLYLTQGPIQ